MRLWSSLFAIYTDGNSIQINTSKTLNIEFTLTNFGFWS